MTPPPLPPPSLPPYAAIVASPPADPRPTSLRVLSILGIVLGAAAMISPLSTLSMYVGQRAMPARAVGGGTTLPALRMQAAMFDASAWPWLIGASVVATVCGAAQIGISIGSLRLRPWARRAMLAYAFVAIGLALGGAALNATIILPAVYAPLASGGGPGAMPAAFVRTFAILVGVLGAVIGSVYPACVLIFFRRPNVVAAFERRSV